MKKVLIAFSYLGFFILGGLTFTYFTSSTEASSNTSNISVVHGNINYFINNVKKNPPEGQSGFIYQGTTYVPLRFISEAMGADVKWESKSKSVYIGAQPSENGVEAEEKTEKGTEENIQAFFDAFAEAVKIEDADKFFSLQYDEFESPEQVKEWFEYADLTYKATLIKVIEENAASVKVRAKVLYRESEDGYEEVSREREETLTLVKKGTENYGSENEFGLKLFLE